MSQMNECCGGSCSCSTTDTKEATPGKGVSYFRPDVDVIERSDAFVVVADLPGANRESIDIEFEKGTLTLTASIATQPKAQSLVREYAVGDYRRVFRIAESINAEAITADYRDGVLTINLPKANEVRARKVEVRAN